jgi:hypothetical protein
MADRLQRWIKAKKSNVNAVSTRGSTPLHALAYSCDKTTLLYARDSARILIEHGADIRGVRKWRKAAACRTLPGQWRKAEITGPTTPAPKLQDSGFDEQGRQRAAPPALEEARPLRASAKQSTLPIGARFRTKSFFKTKTLLLWRFLS